MEARFQRVVFLYMFLGHHAFKFDVSEPFIVFSENALNTAFRHAFLYM